MMADIEKRQIYIIAGVVVGIILLFGVLYFATNFFKPAGEAKEGTFFGAFAPDEVTAGCPTGCPCLSDYTVGNLDNATKYRCRDAACGKDVYGNDKYCYNKTKIINDDELSGEDSVCGPDGCKCTSMLAEAYWAIKERGYFRAPCETQKGELLETKEYNMTELLEHYQLCGMEEGDSGTKVCYYDDCEKKEDGCECSECLTKEQAKKEDLEACGDGDVVCGYNAEANKSSKTVEITALRYCYTTTGGENGGNGKTQCGDGIINASAGENCDPAATKVFGGKTCASYGFDGGNLSCEDCSIKTKDCKNVTLKSCEGDKPAPEDWSDCEEGEQTRKVAECDTSTGEWKMTGTETEECEVEKGLAWWIWLAIGGGVLLLLGGIFAVWYFVFRKPGGAGLSKKTPSPQGGKTNASERAE